ncbi:MAG: hypothetical protein Q7R81_00655 [Candidatus Peregrinibacteria bacterium]|nr:hypothetical protein [Candidatus Peregrinibacteria bacterium]
MKVDIIKAGGSELCGESLPTLAKYLHQTSTRKDTKTLFVFGGGPQIDVHWRMKHLEPRPKRDGVGITSEEVLRDAVVPAYAAIRAALQELLPLLKILEPQDLLCERNTGLGFVGNVKEVKNIQSHKIIGIGFVGSDGTTELNVNADSIVSTLAHIYSSSIGEVMLLTESGGVLDRFNQRIPQLSRTEIDRILKDENPDISATGGMRKKLEEIRLMLEHVPSVLMLKTHELLQKEAMKAGTLCMRNPCL